MSRLLLARHAQTDFNMNHRFCGSTDASLNDEGIRQAGQLRDRLTEEKIDAIYTSKLDRARSTAKIIAARHNLNITACKELNEIDFGRIEGLTFDEISRVYPEVAEELQDGNSCPKFPGGEGLDDVYHRVIKFQRRLDRHNSEETVLIVAHCFTLLLLICTLLDIDVENWRKLRLDLASISVVETYPQGGILSLLNGISHLKA